METLALSYNVKVMYDIVSISNKIFFRNSLIILSYISRTIMACGLAVQCDLIYGCLKCGLPEDTINVDLKVDTLKGIRTFKKEYKSQTSKFSPWGADMQHYPSLQKKMGQFMKRRKTIATPYTNIPSKAKPQKSPRKNLIHANPSPTPE